MTFTEGNGGNGGEHQSPINVVSKSVSLRSLCYLLCKGSSAFAWILRTAQDDDSGDAQSAICF